MDQDGSLNISFNEWRDFLLLAPSSDIHDLIKFWRHSTVSFAFFICDLFLHVLCYKYYEFFPYVFLDFYYESYYVNIFF